MSLSKIIALTSLSLEAILSVSKISSKKSMLNALEGLRFSVIHAI